MDTYNNTRESTPKDRHSKRTIIRWVVGIIVLILFIFFIVGYFVHRSTGLHEDNIKILNDRIVTDLENDL